MKAPPCQFSEIAGKIKSLSMEVRTALSTEELGERLKAFFGKDGLGLELKTHSPDGLTFEDDAGIVTAAFFAEEDKTRLRIVTNGWAVAVKKFVAELP
jgi:hypothetical protein